MIGYYAHHVGSGHVQRAGAIAARLRTPVVGFSSSPAPEGWPGRWIRLPADDNGVDRATSDVTAGGTLHWVPLSHEGLRARMGLMAAELAQGGVNLVVVDVSVEVALLTRLFGVRTVVVGQPGDRTDRPHRMAYDLADRLLLPWPSFAQQPWPHPWLEKSVHLGAVGRFDDRPPVASPGRRNVLVLWGSGGLDVDAAAVRAAAAATPDWHWDVLGATGGDAGGTENLSWHGWVSDVWLRLCAADVVVTHAGQNAVAEVAAARRAAVVVPQTRPHDEQVATAQELDRAGIAVVATQWPAAGHWPQVLDAAAALGGGAWARWSPGDGAARAAAVLDELAGS